LENHCLIGQFPGSVETPEMLAARFVACLLLWVRHFLWRRVYILCDRVSVWAQVRVRLFPRSVGCGFSLLFAELSHP
ncbi:MAG: hypothetical protein AB7H97_17770, partial [Pseudobdellovibrionaceae bacterium]